MRFSTKLGLLITTILLSSLCVMFYFGYASTTRIVEQNERERLEGLAFQVIDKIDRMLFERRADTGVLATDPVIRSGSSSPAQVRARLDEFKRQYRLYSSLSYFTADRIRVADTSGRDIGKRHPLTSYWREIAGGRDRVMTIDEAQTTKEITINFAATVKDDRDRRMGVVVARMPIEGVRRIADQSIQNGGGRAATELELLDANGLILYSSYRRPGMLREQSGDWAHIRGLLAGGESVGSVRHAYEGEDELTAFAREKGYDTFKGNGWVLTLCVPAEDIFASVNEQAKKFSLLFAGIGAAVVLGTLLLSRAATKPLHELSRAAAAIGKGARDVSVRVRSRDEIGQLAQAFNKMALELKESEGRFKEFAEMLPQVVYEIDTTGKVLFVNYHGLEIFGYTQQDIEHGVTMLDVVAPGDHGRLLDNTKKALSGEKIENVEYTALRKDKSAFPFLVFLAPVVRDGRVVGMRGMGIDITERKKAERDAREREAFLTNILDSIQDGISILSPDLNIVRTNRTLEAWLPEQLPFAGRKCYDAYHNRATPCNDCPSLVTLRDGKPSSRIFAVPENGPTQVWLENYTFPLFNAEKTRVDGVIEHVRDVTERKRMEDELRESERRYRDLFNSLHDGIVITDFEGHILELNRIFHERLGLQRDEMLNMAPWEVDTSENAARVAERVDEIRRNGHAIFEIAQIAREGRVIPIEMSVSMIEYRGKPAMLALARDITERKLLEQRFRESERNFRALFEASPDDIAVVGLSGTMLMCNRQAALLHGFDRAEEMVGKQFLDLIAPEDRQRASDNLQLLLTRGSLRGEFLFLKKDGSRFPVEISGAVMTDADGKPTAMLGVVRDITARKQTEELVKRLNEELEQKVRDRTKQLVDAQEELVRKEKLAMLGQIAGSVGHELRNPLGVMNNAVYYLQMVLAESDETVREYLGIIKNEILGAERIVTDLLDAVRTKPPQRQSVQADELLSMSLGKCSIPDHITVLVGSVPQRAVLVDPLQMKQVFINLINNAAEAMPNGGRLTLGADDAGGGVRFTFKDEGTGIAPENRDKIFQPLYTTKARGIGLGLVVVKNLTEANAGTVVVESEPGKGAVFTVTLPAAEA